MKKLFAMLVPVLTGWLFIAAEGPIDYKFHSIYIYNFIKNIEWPAYSGEFKIHILGGDSSIGDTFSKMTESKTIGESKIVVKQFDNLNTLEDCNILFIPESESYLASKAIEKFKGKRTLVITENTPSKKGGSINFVVIGNKLKFEIDKTAIEEAGLKVSAQLLQLGIVK